MQSKVNQCTWQVLACLALAIFWSSGCDSAPENVGRVSGTVTLDGQPLPNAFVKFQPKGQKSSSHAITDSNGRYELKYAGDILGADIGDYVVSISTFNEGDPSSDPPVPKVPEKIPSKYNLKSVLTASVQGGTNTLDYHLKSDGPIIQPDVFQKQLESREAVSSY